MESETDIQAISNGLISFQQGEWGGNTDMKVGWSAGV